MRFKKIENFSTTTYLMIKVGNNLKRETYKSKKEKSILKDYNEQKIETREERKTEKSYDSGSSPKNDQLGTNQNKSISKNIKENKKIENQKVSIREKTKVEKVESTKQDKNFKNKNNKTNDNKSEKDLNSVNENKEQEENIFNDIFNVSLKDIKSDVSWNNNKRRRIIKKVLPDFSKIKNVSGVYEIKVYIEVNKFGVVIFSKIVKSSGNLNIDDLILKSIRLWRFEIINQDEIYSGYITIKIKFE